MDSRFFVVVAIVIHNKSGSMGQTALQRQPKVAIAAQRWGLVHLQDFSPAAIASALCV